MSNILNLYSTDKNQFEPLEPTDEIIDSWEIIIQNINNGTYSTKYRKGQYKPIDLGDEGVVNMQLVALDADDLADGSDKAPTSWVGIELLNSSHRMNPALAGDAGDYTEGTGTIGGYAESEMRDYVSTTLFALLPAELQAAIVEVKKYSRIFNSAGTAVNNSTSNEKLWIPSQRELIDSNAETMGVSYSQFFTTDTLKKSKVGTSDAVNYWTRTANSTNQFRRITSSGSYANSTAPTSNGVCIGFCL